MNLMDDAISNLRDLSGYFPNVNPFGRKDDNYDQFGQEYNDAVEEIKSYALQPILELTRTGEASKNVIVRAMETLKQFATQISTIFGVKSQFKDAPPPADKDEEAAEASEEKQPMEMDDFNIKLGDAFNVITTFKPKAQALFKEIDPTDDEIKILFKFYRFMRNRKRRANENIYKPFVDVGYIEEDIKAFLKTLENKNEVATFGDLIERMVEKNLMNRLPELIFPVPDQTMNDIVMGVHDEMQTKNIDPLDSENIKTIEDEIVKKLGADKQDSLVNKVLDYFIGKFDVDIKPGDLETSDKSDFKSTDDPSPSDKELPQAKPKDKHRDFRRMVLKTVSPTKFGEVVGLYDNKYSDERVQKYHSAFFKFLLALKHFSKPSLQERLEDELKGKLESFGEYTTDTIKKALDVLSEYEKSALQEINKEPFKIKELYELVKEFYESEEFSLPLEDIKLISPQFFSKGHISVPDPEGGVKIPDSPGIESLSKEEIESHENLGKLLKKTVPRLNLSGYDLNRKDLSKAHLSTANLSDANLSQAVLSGADLLYAKLIGANLSYSDLSEADLQGADLSDADLTGADLTGALFDNDTQWPKDFKPVDAGAKKTEDNLEEAIANKLKPLIREMLRRN